MYKMLKVLWYILLWPKILPHLQYKRKMPLKQPYSSFLIKEYIDPYVYYWWEEWCITYFHFFCSPCMYVNVVMVIWFWYIRIIDTWYQRSSIFCLTTMIYVSNNTVKLCSLWLGYMGQLLTEGMVYWFWLFSHSNGFDKWCLKHV